MPFLNNCYIWLFTDSNLTMNKQQKILLSTLELVVNQGVSGTPMSLVAKNANVAVGTIYHYYKDKNDIIHEIYRMIRKDFATALMVETKHLNTAKARFGKLWMALYHYYITNPLAFHFYVYIARPPIISAETLEETKAAYQQHAARLQTAIDYKIIRDLPVDILLRMFHDSVTTMVEVKINRAYNIPNEVLENAMSAAWDYLKHPEYDDTQELGL